MWLEIKNSDRNKDETLHVSHVNPANILKKLRSVTFAVQWYSIDWKNKTGQIKCIVSQL
jgi:hypothetical protein